MQSSPNVRETSRTRVWKMNFGCLASAYSFKRYCVLSTQRMAIYATEECRTVQHRARLWGWYVRYSTVPHSQFRPDNSAVSACRGRASKLWSLSRRAVACCHACTSRSVRGLGPGGLSGLQASGANKNHKCRCDDIKVDILYTVIIHYPVAFYHKLRSGQIGIPLFTKKTRQSIV